MSVWQANYAIVRCPACGGISVARFWTREKVCPYCGLRFTLRPKAARSRIISHAFTYRQAQALAAQLIEKYGGPKVSAKATYKPPRGRPRRVRW